MQHTPGPWTVVGSSIEWSADNETVATITDHETMTPRQAANAALVAAAPAMLEALQAIVCHEHGLQKFRLEKALAAIRAATGEV